MGKLKNNSELTINVNVNFDKEGFQKDLYEIFLNVKVEEVDVDKIAKELANRLKNNLSFQCTR